MPDSGSKSPAEFDRWEEPSRPGGLARRLQHLATGQTDEIDLAQLLRTLWRRKALILSTAVLLTVLAALVIFQITPRYTAAAQVMLETRRSQVTDIESVISGITPEMATLLGEVEVIQSASLVGRVVDKLNLTTDPEFNGSLRPEPWYAEWLKLETYLPEDVLRMLGLYREQPMLLPEEQTAQTRARVVAAVQSALSVGPVGRSLVIRIDFKSPEPRKAALIANTISDEYIVDQLEAKFEATRRATSWLNERLTSLREQVRSAEDAVEHYRRSVAEQLGQGSDLTNQQLSELNSALIEAQTQRAEADARLEQVTELLASEGDLNSAAEVLNSPLISRLREQESQVLRRVSELETRYGERHPEMVKARSERNDLQNSIEGEVRKIAQSLRNEVQVARARVGTLQANLDRLESRGQAQNQAEIRLRELQREAEANRALYENFLSRFKETREQEDLQQADARVISHADVPINPSFPNKRLMLALAGMMALGLGVGLAFLLEHLDNTFRSSQQLEAATGLPVIGMVPFIGGIIGLPKVGRYVSAKPSSQASEAIRSLRTSVMLSDVDNPPQVITVTSTTPGEGKSTIALWLAEVAALSGRRALIIDMDLRRPTIHKVLSLPNENGVVELMTRKCAIEDAVQVSEDTGIWAIPAGIAEANALDILSSHRIAECLGTLRKHFDLIVLDTPPVLAVSDARVIGRLCDKVIYVVKWDETPRELVRSGIRAAADAQLDIVGLALAQVNLKKHVKYGYGDYGYYYGKYKSYYAQ